MDVVEIIKDVGFPAAIVIYLLWERNGTVQRLIDKIDKLIVTNTSQIEQVCATVNDACASMKIALLEAKKSNK